MATVEDIRDVMHDEYPHLKPSIPEIGRLVKLPFWLNSPIYLTLDIKEDTIRRSSSTAQIVADIKVIMVGDNKESEISLALNNRRLHGSLYSWEYAERS